MVQQLEPTVVSRLTSARSRLSSRKQRDALLAYVLLSPAAALYLIFIAGPLIAALWISLFNWDLLSPATFTGLTNYEKLFSDPVVHAVLVNTVIFTVSSVVLHVGLGLLAALAVNRAMPAPLNYLLRTAFFFPQLISWAAVALMWKYILDPNFGFVTYYLSKLGLSPPDWLASPQWAMPSLIFVDFWRTFGFVFIVLLAGLRSIPPHFYEAAVIDGAGPLHRFRYVTIPLLSPTLFFASVITFIGAFQIFEPMFIMTQGGPGNATQSIVMLIYETAFRQFQMGYACAQAALVLVAIMCVTLIQLLASRYWVHYD